MRVKMEHWIAVVATAAFSSVLGHGFVYDDAWTIVENSWLDRPLGDIVALLASGEGMTRIPDATRPVMVVSLWLDRRLFGLSPVGHHLDSLLLYGLNCALAALLALRATRKRIAALVAAVFFALAPLHAEPVAAVNYREDLLAGAGVLGAWLLVLGRRPVASAADQSWLSAGFASTLWVAALLAKESAVVLLPLVGLTALVLPHERQGIRSRSRVLFALLVGGSLWLLWRLPLALRGDDIPLAPDRGGVDRIHRSARFAVRSALNAVWPSDWAPDHWRQPGASPAWLVALALLIAAVVLLGRIRRGRIFAFGLGIAIVAPLPASPLFRPVNEVADRYFFLGVLGGAIIWGAALAIVARRAGLGRRRSLVALLCLPWIVPAWQATAIWRDERSLWTAALERKPESPRAWAALSRVHRLAGEQEAAKAAVERAVVLDPNYAPALVTRVYNELSSGELERARRHLADMDRRGLGNAQGVQKARRCVVLEAQAARACINGSGPLRREASSK